VVTPSARADDTARGSVPQVLQHAIDGHPYAERPVERGGPLVPVVPPGPLVETDAEGRVRRARPYSGKDWLPASR
jgi:hypothetical protein